MDDKEILNMLLFDTMQSMRQEGLVDDRFIFLYSMKKHIEDPFCVEVITNFCSDARDVLKLLTQIMSDVVLNFKLMEECIFKVKGSALSVGACRVAQAFTNFQSAIRTASKDECLKALDQTQQEYSTLEQRLHIWIQLERRIILSIPLPQWSSKEFNFVDAKDIGDGTLQTIVPEGTTSSKGKSIAIPQCSSEEFNFVDAKDNNICDGSFQTIVPEGTMSSKGKSIAIQQWSSEEQFNFVDAEDNCDGMLESIVAEARTRSKGKSKLV